MEDLGGDEVTDQPRVGKPLPGAEAAYIDRDKLVDYALNPDSPAGRHEADVFRLALGIERGDWEHLRAWILSELPHYPVTGLRPPRHDRDASTWEVLVPIQGLRARSERRLKVITAWEMVGGRPELVTLRVASRGRQG